MNPSERTLRRPAGAILAAALLAGALAGCVGAPGRGASADATSAGAGIPDDGATPPLARVIRVLEGDDGEEIAFGALIARLAAADVVFIGETHVDEVTHRTEHALLEALARARDGRVVLAMEMFTRADQPALDRYLAGDIDEETFLSEARVWSNYRTGYRALIETARREGFPVIGSNLAPDARRKLAMGGADALSDLTDEERRGVARELLPNSPEYWERFDRTVRGHAGSMGTPDPDARLTSVQSLWDNTMGESCADALAAHPGHLVVHVNGGFHSWRGLGTAEQVAKRAPDAEIVTVQVVPVGDLAAIEAGEDDERADFIVFAEARARGLSEGTHAVVVGRELPYRLHRPEGAGPFPLLVWFPDEGANAEDEARRLRLLLGDEAVLAVVEHPYPVIEDDLHTSGRWTWEETFYEDLGVLGSATDRIVDVVTRYHDVDEERVVLAGRGSGARVAASVRWQDRDGPATVAIDPVTPGRLAEAGLPDPRDPSGGELLVLADASVLDAWRDEVSARASVGFPGRAEPLPEGAGVAALREALGLPAADTDAPVRTLWISHGSPLARQWAALAAARLGGRHRIEVLPDDGELPDDPLDGSLWLEIDLEPVHDPTIDRPRAPIAPRFGPEDLAEGRGIPFPPGPFGGTVVLVLPEGLSDDRRIAWRTLEEDDVTRRRSRFVGLRIAETGRERDLPAVLDELRAEGKSVVRVSPVRFCSTANEMRALRASAAGHDEGLRIAWTPGLGGELWRVLPAADGSEANE